MKKAITLFSIFLLTILTSSISATIVETKFGKIRGFPLTTYTGKEITAFFGVPYAKPPVGELRFKKPVPPKPWNNILEATELPKICLQKWVHAWHEKPKPMSEDCLYLTISVPKSSSGQKLPVMVRFHGGGFEYGGLSLEWSNSTTLAAEENVIVVMVGYRLGVMGFLYLDTSSVPGNVGLWDQNMAIKWVKENIEAFGGDPDSITLFGESAGGASGNYHLLSTHSHPYFNRAILDSGVSTNPWAFMEPKKTLELALTVSRNVGCKVSEDREEVSRCLLNVDAMKLVEETSKLVSKMPCSFLFVPTLDGDFIADYPRNLMSKGEFKDTNLLMGVTSNEGALFLPLYFGGTEEPAYLTDKLLTKKHFQVISGLYSPGGDRFIRDVIVHRYTNWTDPELPENLLDSMDKLMGDVIFTCDMNLFADQATNHGRTIYKYVFDFKHEALILPSDYPLSLHAHQSLHAYGYFMNPALEAGPQGHDVSKKVMRMWANFARTGNPNLSPDGSTLSVEWPKYSVESKEYFKIGTQDSVGYGYRDDYCAFWRELIPKLTHERENCPAN